MTSSTDSNLTFHNDKVRFSEALNYTAGVTNFSPRLIEKDYYCSLVLHDLSQQEHNSLVFKGGTCLCKIHAGFYRLSEDLDFLIPVAVGATRAKRRKAIEPVKAYFKTLAEHLPCFQAKQNELVTHGRSELYTGTLPYKSVLADETGEIQIEISLYEPVLGDITQYPARTLLRYPTNNELVVPSIATVALSRDESYAEKFRAALSRRKGPEIRDFYDIAHAVKAGLVDIDNARFVELVKRKLAIRGTITLPDNLHEVLRQQLRGRLEPNLKNVDFGDFDVDRAIAVVTDFVAKHGLAT